MKQLSILVIIGIALSLCNLTERLRGRISSEEPGSSSSSTSREAKVEKPTPTAAQTAALAGGQTASWDKQGMSWTVPPRWTLEEDQAKSYMWRSPGSWDAASLIVSISPMDEKFPTEDSLNAYYESAKSREKNGEVDEVRWLEIDGLKGVQFRESNPETPDGHRRLQWLAYRKYAGQVQMINLMLATTGKDFARHQDAMYGIMYSTKIVH